MGDPDILSWCPYNQSCKGNLCNLWEQNAGECLLRLKLKLQIEYLIFKLRRGVK